MRKLEENVMRQSIAAFFGLSLFLCSALAVSACDEVASASVSVSGQQSAVPVVHAGEIKAGDDALVPTLESAPEETNKTEAVKKTEAVPKAVEIKKADESAGMEESQTPSGTAASANVHFDMDALIERLKNSDAIGMFTKLALRSDAMDVMDAVKAYHKREKQVSLDQVRARFDGLLLKVMALLDNDPALSGDISMAREDIWRSLMEVKA